MSRNSRNCEPTLRILCWCGRVEPLFRRRVRWRQDDLRQVVETRNGSPPHRRTSIRYDADHNCVGGHRIYGAYLPYGCHERGRRGRARDSVKVRLPDRPQDVSALGRGELDFLIGWMTAPARRCGRGCSSRTNSCASRARRIKLGDGLSYEKYLELPHVQYDIPGKTTTERLLQTGSRGMGGSGTSSTMCRIRSQLRKSSRIRRHCDSAEKFADAAAPLLAATVDLPFSVPTVQNRAYWHESVHSDARNCWCRKILADVAKTI